MDRKEKLEIIEADLATRTAGLSVGDALADVRAELAALKPKRWPDVMAPGNCVAARTCGNAVMIEGIDNGPGEAECYFCVTVSRLHAIEMAHELLRLAGGDDD